MCKCLLLVLLLSLGLLSSCATDAYQTIDENFRFGYSERPDYTNIYCNGLAVVPGGCDNAKWNKNVIVARGLLANHSYKWSTHAALADDNAFYFIINKVVYLQSDGLQEQNKGFTGPLSEKEFQAIDPLPAQPFCAPD